VGFEEFHLAADYEEHSQGRVSFAVKDLSTLESTLREVPCQLQHSLLGQLLEQGSGAQERCTVELVLLGLGAKGREIVCAGDQADDSGQEGCDCGAAE